MLVKLMIHGATCRAMVLVVLSVVMSRGYCNPLPLPPLSVQNIVWLATSKIAHWIAHPIFKLTKKMDDYLNTATPLVPGHHYTDIYSFSFYPKQLTIALCVRRRTPLVQLGVKGRKRWCFLIMCSSHYMHTGTPLTHLHASTPKRHATRTFALSILFVSNSIQLFSLMNFLKFYIYLWFLTVVALVLFF